MLISIIIKLAINLSCDITISTLVYDCVSNPAIGRRTVELKMYLKFA